MSTVSAINNIFLFRIEGESGNAWKLAYQTDGSTDESREFTTEPTKDGNVKSAGAYEGTHSLTSYLAQGDEYVRELQQLVRDDDPKRLELWEINRTAIEEGSTIPGDYSTDFVNNVGKSAGSDGNVEVTIETEVDGKVIAGEVEVTPELLAILQTISEDQEFVQPMESA